MANIFGILTAITLVITAFVAYKNKASYEEKISETATQKGNLAKSKTRLKTAQDGVKTTNDKRTETEAEIVTLTEETATQQKAVDDLKLQIEAKTAKVAANKAQLDVIREKTAQSGELKGLAAKMRELSSEREALTQSIAETEAKLANLTAQNNQADGQVKEVRGRLETMSSGQSLPTLNTRIRSIYPTWGFVTLAAGNNGGVVAGSTLNVVRDDQTIAQLLVTSVERGSASASIIPDSVAPDTTLMIGDRVVPAAKTEKSARP
jgi:peptidoglycan hydrolase CwlO-like protein